LLGGWGPDAGTRTSRGPTAATHVGTTLAAGDRTIRWARGDGDSRVPPCPGDRGRWALTRHLARRWRACGTTGPGTTPSQHEPPVGSPARPAAPPTAPGAHRPPPRRAPDAEKAMAQDAALPDHAKPSGAGDAMLPPGERVGASACTTPAPTPLRGAWDHH